MWKLLRKLVILLVTVGIYFCISMLMTLEQPSHRITEFSNFHHGQPLLAARDTRPDTFSGSGVSLTLWNSFRGFLKENTRFLEYSATRFPYTERLPWNLRVPVRRKYLPGNMNLMTQRQAAVNDEPENYGEMKVNKTNMIQTPLDVLHIVMVFPLLLTQSWQKQGYNTTDVELLKQREVEYVDCLRANLRVLTVAKVHIFTDQPERLRDKLLHEYVVDLSKVHFFESSSNPTYRDIFEYVSIFLHQHLVFIMNADNYLGDGFDRIDATWWQANHRTMYALTRHTLPNRTADCEMNSAGYCDNNGQYFGSHDAFLLHMHALIPEKLLAQLEFPSHVYGSENVVIWAFRKFLQFTVTNPCRRLVIYHNHCVQVRASGAHRKRVQNVGVLGTAGFEY